MAEQHAVTGTVDKKPLSHEMQTKVQDALKSALSAELTLPGVRPPHHIEITHIDITFDKV
jgi:hypothetical protein